MTAKQPYEGSEGSTYVTCTEVNIPIQDYFMGERERERERERNTKMAIKKKRDRDITLHPIKRNCH